MKRQVCAAAVLALCCLANAADAAKQSAAPSGLRAIQLECFKQYGGYQDPQTKKWVMQGSMNNMQATTDAIYACVAQKTGKPAAPFLTHTYTTP